MEWKVKAFNELSNTELYDILKLRAEVFVVEQNCIYQDLDDLDKESQHLLGFDGDGKLAAYLRILPIDTERAGFGSIGRVVISPKQRGKRLGHELLQKGLESYDLIFPNTPMIIEAQAYLQKFYEGHGFIAEGEVFMLDGIPHLNMIRD